jgi:purine-binding chemotaxis protein CheW
MANIVPKNQMQNAEEEEYVPEMHEFVTLRIDGQLLGISVMHVEDVLKSQNITPVPLTPHEVVGTLNLRGRIVTAIDMRARLGLEPIHNPEACMSVVVDQQDHLYSLLIDEVGDVLSLPLEKFERTPPNLDESWHEIAAGVYRLESELLVILDVPRMLAAKQVEMEEA